MTAPIRTSEPTVDDDGPMMMIVGEIGDAIHTNDNESYRPSIAEEFVRDVAPDGEGPSAG